MFVGVNKEWLDSVREAMGKQYDAYSDREIGEQPSQARFCLLFVVLRQPERHLEKNALLSRSATGRR